MACGHALVYQNGGMNNRWLQEQVRLAFHPESKSLPEGTHSTPGAGSTGTRRAVQAKKQQFGGCLGGCDGDAFRSLSFLCSGSKRESPENTMGHHAPVLQRAEISCINSLVCFSWSMLSPELCLPTHTHAAFRLSLPNEINRMCLNQTT